MSDDQHTISMTAIRQSRPRVAGAVVGFAAIFGVSIVVLTSMLPSPAGSYLKDLLFFEMIILAAGAYVYYQRRSGWRDFAAGLVLGVMTITLFIMLQFTVNAEVPHNKTWNVSHLLVTLALVLVVANMASLVVRKTIFGGFKLIDAEEPKLF